MYVFRCFLTYVKRLIHVASKKRAKKIRIIFPWIRKKSTHRTKED